MQGSDSVSGVTPKAKTTVGSSATRRRTPCVGICSTTYGDMVCRGCKRYAHEIVQWNAYSPSQRATIEQRLVQLRDGATDECVAFGRRDVVIAECAERGMPADLLTQSTTASLVYELLCRSLSNASSLEQAGIRLLAGDTPLATVQAIDRAFLARSSAHYERAFKTPLV